MVSRPPPGNLGIFEGPFHKISVVWMFVKRSDSFTSIRHLTLYFNYDVTKYNNFIEFSELSELGGILSSYSMHVIISNNIFNSLFQITI